MSLCLVDESIVCAAGCVGTWTVTGVPARSAGADGLVAKLEAPTAAAALAAGLRRRGNQESRPARTPPAVGGGSNPNPRPGAGSRPLYPARSLSPHEPVTRRLCRFTRSGSSGRARASPSPCGRAAMRCRRKRARSYELTVRERNESAKMREKTEGKERTSQPTPYWSRRLNQLNAPMARMERGSAWNETMPVPLL